MDAAPADGAHTACAADLADVLAIAVFVDLVAVH
jgi:hypothetical protein